MTIDLVMILIILMYMIIGFRRGLWLNSLHLSSTLVSLFIAHRFYQYISKQMIVLFHFLKQLLLTRTSHFNTMMYNNVLILLWHFYVLLL